MKATERRLGVHPDRPFRQVRIGPPAPPPGTCGECGCRFWQRESDGKQICACASQTARSTQ